jgi:hypothetical protein
VNITIQFGPDAVGEPVVVETLNGGTTSIGGSIPVIGVDGAIRFAFLARAGRGVKSLGIRTGSRIFHLRFSVLDSSHG